MNESAIRITNNVSIPTSELSFRFARSGGPGGQHANRSATQVELLFDVANSPSLNETQQDSKKTICGWCGTTHRSHYDKKMRRIRDLSCGDARIYLEVEVRRVLCRGCGRVKREKLDWIADNPFYTKRFAFYVGRKCRTMTVQDVAKELKLDWHTVKALDKEYMQEQLRQNPVAAPGVIGIDEVSLWKGHTYRIVVSDLERGRPIWYGGVDRCLRRVSICFISGLARRRAKRYA